MFVVGVVALAFSLFTLALPVLAQVEATDPGPYLGLEYGAATGLGDQDVRYMVAQIISVALGLLGIVAVVLVIYAGFKWMTAGGNEENASSARKILFSAVIGLVIILAAYSITRFVMVNLFQATTGNVYNEISD